MTWTNEELYFQCQEGRSALHMTAVHGRFTRAQTLIAHGERAYCFKHIVLKSKKGLGKAKMLHEPYPRSQRVVILLLLVVEGTHC